MLSHPPALWRRLSERLFRHLSLPEGEGERLRALSERGQVVYILRTRSLLDYLAFNYMLVKAGAPLARFANGVNLTLLRGLSEWARGLLTGREAGSAEQVFLGQLAHGDAALLFLRERTWTQGRNVSPAFMEGLVGFQRVSERPVLLVPLVIHWPPAPPSQQRSLMDILFGDVEEAGRLRKAVHFVRYAKRASVRVGEPIDLAAILDAQGDWTDARVARKLRRQLRVQLGKEAMFIHGPPVKPPEKLTHEILERQVFKQELASYAEASGEGLDAARAKAARYLGEIASKPKYVVQMLISHFLDFLFFRVFSGVEVNEEDVRRVKEAARASWDAPLILVPSHKSHVDYLVVSWVFIRHDFVPPHVAAGANLNFFPVGALLRNAGAFFLRRSFVGLDLYKMVFKHYVWKIVHEGYPLEFFIEGGRTRTGKLITPKMGVLSMLLEGVTRGEYKDLQFVPVNLSYERVVETDAYRKELTGGEKQGESVGGVLAARKVLRSRYGRIYAHFEPPVRLSEYLRARGLPELPKGGERFKVETERLAFHLMYRIQEATVISPSALVGFVALSHERPALSHERLTRLSGFIVALAEARGARLSRSIKQALARSEAPLRAADAEGRAAGFRARGEALNALTDEALALLRRLIERVERGAQVMYVVPNKSRIELDYYRNGILGLIAPEVIVCTVVASHPEGLGFGALKAESRWLSELLKLEFIYRNDKPFAQIISELLTTLCAVGLIEEEPGAGEPRYVIRQEMEEEALTLSSALRHLLECYWVAAHTLKGTAQSPTEAKAWVRMASDQAELAVLHGEIRRAEASSTVTFANALQWFVRQGWVQERTVTEGKRRAKTYEVIDPDSFEQFFTQLATVIANLPDGPAPTLSPLQHLQRRARAEALSAQPQPAPPPEEGAAGDVEGAALEGAALEGAALEGAALEGAAGASGAGALEGEPAEGAPDAVKLP